MGRMVQGLECKGSIFGVLPGKYHRRHLQYHYDVDDHINKKER